MGVPVSRRAVRATKSETAQNERRSLLTPDVARWPVDTERPIVELSEVKKGFDGELVLNGLSLKIPTGKTTVIIGESGSGKSVLLKMMNGLVRPASGSVKLFGQELSGLSDKDTDPLRKRTGMVLQNYALIDSISVLDNVAFPLVENIKMARSEVEDRVMDLLKMLGIADAARRLPSDLSGGMKKRVSFARAVVTEPELVLFDEPTTGLDPLMIMFVDELIQQMQERFEITSVIISHDIASVFALADYIAMLHAGKIIEYGTPEEIRATENEAVSAFISVGGSGRLGAGSSAAAQVDAAELQTAPLIRVTDLHKSFGTNHVLRGINLEIYPKEITVIIGGSGSGKSVLMKHLLGLFLPDSGTVEIGGRLVNEMNEDELEQLRLATGMLFQGAALFDSMSVYDNVAFPLLERRKPAPKDSVAQLVEDILVRLQIDEIAKALPSDISAGQRKRVGLARAIVTKPSLMIYDEPTTGQDPVMIRYVDDMIVQAHTEFDLTTIVISHDMQSTFRVADRIALVHQGTIAIAADPETVKQSRDPNVRKFIFAGSED